jgi:hypothetical protein
MRLSSKFLVPAVLLLSSLSLPSLSFATSDTDFSNGGGILSGTSAGLSLTGSTLFAVNGYGGGALTTGDLGTVTFTTGALSSGTLLKGGSFAPGGSFTVEGNGTGGLPNGVLFSGTFSGTVTWTLTTLANGTHDYTLTGVVTGMMGGASVNGVSVQLTINTGKGYFNGSTTISGGDTTVAAAVPEPSTLALLGTGALAFAGTLRRKILAAL